ncbi:zinc-ribbon domain-containing protein [Roseomonas xinghualingensis]|uniref:zinc-ribbon domain-containing protein n=1 Tax=Roseomonas xinghualingensis TaxID=2986475 RepID=UPI0021F0B33C|nr:zinc-ribbon domain-containing protein [Roseomonas sp. SXEYE001]MCV4205870.1 zinc-ribbon domain-containing protein [Roseomonas sp. SXEYE001]
MRVACPECTAEYDLPDTLAARLGEGRTVRCARCGTTWAPAAGQPAETPAAPGPHPEAPLPVAPMLPAAPMAPEAAAAPVISSAPATPVSPAMPLREPALPAPAEPDPSNALADLFTADEPLRRASPPAPRQGAHPAVPPTPPIATALAWTASVVALLGIAAAAWHWRFDIVEAWPPAVRAFMALGLG